MSIAGAEVPQVEIFFTFIEDQKLLGYVPGFVSVLFKLKLAFVSYPVFYELSLVIYHLLDFISLKIVLD